MFYTVCVRQHVYDRVCDHVCMTVCRTVWFMARVCAFRYTTLFVVAFPLAPLLALISNFVEIRVDAYKVLHGSLRPIPRGAQDIGGWLRCTHALVCLLPLCACLLCVCVCPCGAGTRPFRHVLHCIDFPVCGYDVM